MIYPWRRRVVPLGRPARDRDWQTGFLGDEREHGQILEEMRKGRGFEFSEGGS
ncbi:hypothetical protein ACWCPF_12020 [Streptomyces sp. NPDC001858]